MEAGRPAQGRQKVAYRIYWVGSPRAPDLRVGDHAVALSLGRQPPRLQAMIGRCQPVVRLVRRRRRRDEVDQVQAERFAILLGRPQMAEMDRIEAAAEQAYAHPFTVPFTPRSSARVAR